MPPVSSSAKVSSESSRQWGRENFSYPFAVFEAQAHRHGFDIELRDDYPHPCGQRMAVLKIRTQTMSV
jgi:hypothetical protein